MKQPLVAALLGLVAGFVLAGHAADGQDQVSGDVWTWPPPPEKFIVNQAGSKDFGRNGKSQFLYTVPEDRWLVITDFRTLKMARDLFPQPDLMMRRAGAKKSTLVLPWQLSGPAFSANTGSAVGLKFPPKSQVVLRRTRDGTNSLGCYYFFAGYLTP